MQWFESEAKQTHNVNPWQNEHLKYNRLLKCQGFQESTSPLPPGQQHSIPQSKKSSWLVHEINLEADAETRIRDPKVSAQYTNHQPRTFLPWSAALDHLPLPTLRVIAVLSCVPRQTRTSPPPHLPFATASFSSLKRQVFMYVNTSSPARIFHHHISLPGLVVVVVVLL